MTLRFQKGICLDGLVSLSHSKKRVKKGRKHRKNVVKSGIFGEKSGKSWQKLAKIWHFVTQNGAFDGKNISKIKKKE